MNDSLPPNLSSRWVRKSRNTYSNFLLALCVCSLGCRVDPSPDEQFKAIVDMKASRLRNWFFENKPDIARDYRENLKSEGLLAETLTSEGAVVQRCPLKVTGEVVEEKDVDLRMDHVYVGTIRVFVPTRFNGGAAWGYEMIAIYWYSIADKQWVYKGIVRGRDVVPEDSPITPDEITAAFQSE